MRLLLLVNGVCLGIFCLAMELTAKDYPWGRLSVISSDEQQLTFELSVDWPSDKEGASYGDASVGFELPGASLNPEPELGVPYTLGASLLLPAVRDVELEILETEFDLVLQSELSLAERWFQKRRASAFQDVFGAENSHLRGSDSGIGLQPLFDEVPPFLEKSSIGWMRQHRIADLRCYPFRVDLNRSRAERLSRLRGRLVFGDHYSREIVRKRVDRLASPSFDQIAEHHVANPSRVAPQVLTKSGLTKRAHESSTEPEMILRITLEETGVYQLTAPALVSAGVELEGVDPNSFRLIDSDRELPLLVEDGGDGRLDGNDRIVFYGEALDSLYSMTRSYVLRWGGQAGKRMEVQQTQAVATQPFPMSAVERVRFEEDLHYSQNMISEPGEDHWFWGAQLLGPESRDFPVTLSDAAVSPNEVVRFRIGLKGLSSIPEVVFDHHTRVYLDGVLMSDELWDGNERFLQTFETTAGSVLAGGNVVTVEVVGDRPGDLDQVFVDWIEVDYPRLLIAREGRLSFNGAFGANWISGFQNDAISLLDVSDPTAVKRLEGFDVRLESQGFQIAFDAGVFPSGRFVALDQFAYRVPIDIELVPGSDWKDPSHQADYLIVTHRSFIEALEPLVKRREVQGLSTVVVPIDELYDEFASGVPTADAIQAFVRHAYHHWQAPAPLYLLLVGDSTIDPRDIFGTGTPNLVPTEITEMRFFGESVSDDGFVLVDGDDFLPDLLVGRFPAESVEDLNVMLQKTFAYENQSTQADWNRRVLVVADDDSAVYEELSENLVATLPDTFEADRVYLSNYPPGDPNRDIFQRTAEGRLLVNYTGHGSRSTWGIGDIGGILFENADAATLGNSENLTVVTVANCLNGFFVARSAKPCLAEVFLRNSSGGAVAVWAPTSLGFPSGHRLLVGNFYKSVFESDQIELGAAVLGAKVATLTDAGFFNDQVKSYTFFGDPAVKLAVPNRIQPVSVQIEVSAQDEVLISYDVESGRDYVVEALGRVGAGEAWLALPNAPHNSGQVRVSPESGAQYFRVRVSLMQPQEVEVDQ